MYTKRTAIFAAALLMLAACQTEVEIQEDISTEDNTTGVLITAPDIHASLETGTPTKSSLEVDGEGVGTIFWNPADEINVFYGTTSTHYTSQNATNATTAVFKTSDVIGVSEGASENIWGLYPYNPSATCTGTAVNTTLPATQYGVPGTFDDDLFITLAHNTSTALVFYNVCGGIKFSLSRDDITSITFRGNNNEDIAGDISLAFSEGLPTVSVTSGVKEITLTPKAGGSFASGEYYYIILLPGVLSNGFTMTFTTSGAAVGSFNYTLKAVTIKRSVFGKKAEINTYVPSFDIPSNIVVYTTSDGNTITPNNMFPVSNVYSNGIGVLTFDKAVTAIGVNGFSGSTTLTSITMPNTVTDIGRRAFYNCTNLSSVTMSSGIIHMNEDCFYGCNSLLEITIPDNDGWIYNGAFANCSSLTEIIIPDGVRVATNTFLNCTSLTSVRLPADLTALPNGLFKGCTNLSSVSIPTGVTSIGDYAFDSSGLTSISIPNSVTSIGGSAFNKCTGLTSIVIPRNVTSLGLGAVGRCTNLESITVLPTVPPTAYGMMFYQSTCPIYVPSASVGSYKAASEWSTYADRIQAIP